MPWVQGRYEIGPRALGHRSLFAEPFNESTLQKLNSLKKRETYRPIAPICLERESREHFEVLGDHRHMLYTVKVTNPKLKAITHVDGTARLQTISNLECKITSDLLRVFGKHTGASVLCNTSLNYNGRGFINTMQHLVDFAEQNQIKSFVVNDFIYRRQPTIE